jgi:hypothetical protein
MIAMWSHAGLLRHTLKPRLTQTKLAAGPQPTRGAVHSLTMIFQPHRSPTACARTFSRMIKSPEQMLNDETEMRAFLLSFGFSQRVIERAIKVRQGIARAAGLEPHAKTLRGARKSVRLSSRDERTSLR